MNDGLAIFLREKRQVQEERKDKMVVIKELCPSVIEAFFKRLEDWLSDLIEEKMISISYEILAGNKKNLVNYKYKVFKLKTGENEIKFIPKERFAVGTTGKIEMRVNKCNSCNIYFIRDSDGIWKQVISKSPLSLKILTRSNFRELLKSVLNSVN